MLPRRVLFALLAGVSLSVTLPIVPAAQAQGAPCGPVWFGVYGIGYPCFGVAGLPVPVAVPYPVGVPVPDPVPVPQAVPVPQPVANPVPVPYNVPVAAPVPQPVPVPAAYPVPAPVPVPAAYPVPYPAYPVFYPYGYGPVPTYNYPTLGIN